MYLAADRGVSLTETLIALTLIAILSALALPSFSGMISNNRLQKAARQIVTDLQFAKMKAISEGLQYQVNFDTVNNSYIIERGDKSSDSSLWTSIQIPRALRVNTNPYFVKGVSIFQNFPNDRAIFSPTGTSNMGTVKVSLDSCIDGKASCQTSPKRSCERCITTLLTGRISIVK